MSRGPGDSPSWPLLLRAEGESDPSAWQVVVADLEGFLGADEPAGSEPAASEPAGAVRLWFRTEAERAEAVRRLDGTGAARGIRELAPEPGRDWMAPCRSFFRGVVAGGFFIHVPGASGHRSLPSLRIAPGQAFGTGTHASTRLALECLADGLAGAPPARRARLRVLDVGSGSGVLSVAAARLGAGRVTALDVDPVAVRATRETARRNGAGGISCFEGDFREAAVARRLDRREPDGFDWILANLSARLAPALAGFAAPRLRAGGRLVVSGFLGADAPDVLAACRRAALDVRQSRAEPDRDGVDDEWVAAVLGAPR